MPGDLKIAFTIPPAYESEWSDSNAQAGPGCFWGFFGLSKVNILCHLTKWFVIVASINCLQVDIECLALAYTVELIVIV